MIDAVIYASWLIIIYADWRDASGHRHRAAFPSAAEAQVTYALLFILEDSIKIIWGT